MATATLDPRPRFMRCPRRACRSSNVELRHAEARGHVIFACRTCGNESLPVRERSTAPPRPANREMFPDGPAPWAR